MCLKWQLNFTSSREVHFMNNNYNSVYGLHIQQFIDLKKALGVKYVFGILMLSHIDRLANKGDEILTGITKEFAEQWGKKKLNETDIYRYNRIRILVQFSSYLADMGIQSHIPKLPFFQKSTFIPHIYSQHELEAIFKACDKLISYNANMNSCLISIPALIRLLYSTGLRISEALALNIDDVNLEESYLRVKDAKNGKERIIPISLSLTAVCKNYIEYRNHLSLKDVKSGYFFVKLNGGKCERNSVSQWFKKCLKAAGISYAGTKNGPRIHDLRHTFAVTSLANMAEAGIDLYASLPIISNYLGHQSVNSTNHYVRLTSNMYPDLLQDVDTICLDVFPKFKNYETD